VHGFLESFLDFWGYFFREFELNSNVPDVSKLQDVDDENKSCNPKRIGCTA
jgi:hypothetical protein